MNHENVVNLAHVPILLAAILFILVFFIPIIQGDFLWDDRTLLLELSTPPESSAQQPLLEQMSLFSDGYFRPLPLATFNVELRLRGANAALLHLVNLLLHLTNTVLVMGIALILIERNDRLNGVRWLAILVGLLYAVHPVMVESVAFISGRIDLLLTLFLLLALLADLQLRQRNLARVAAVTIAFLLAMLTKETTIVFIAVLVAWHLATRDQNSSRREALMIYTGVLAVSLLYLGFRYFVLGYPQLAASASTAYAGSALQKLLMTVRSLGEYLLLLVWPFTGLTPIHFVSLPIPINDPVTWFYVMFLLTLLFVVIWSVHKMPAAGWLAVAGVVALLPASILGPLSPWSGSIITERSLVFPLALLSLAAIPGIYYMLLWRQTHSTSNETSVPAILGRQFMTPGTTIIGLWLIACSITVALTIPYWRTDLTLWSWASQRAPRSPVPAANLVLAYSSLGAYPS